MKKMSLEALQSRAESVVSNELLTSISGGTENACHDGPQKPIIIGVGNDTGTHGGGGSDQKPIIVSG